MDATFDIDHTAREIRPKGKTVEVENAFEQVQDIPYDRLVIATEAAPVRPPIAGFGIPSVYQLHPMEDSFRIHEHESGRHQKSFLIVGGSCIGLEMADALRRRGRRCK